jgi:2,4-dienoyl-CoA reductase (NADPH2)
MAVEDSPNPGGSLGVTGFKTISFERMEGHGEDGTMGGAAKFQRLLEPGRIGSVRTRNRIIKTAAGLSMWHEDDVHMREEVKAFYEGIARGGVGLIIVESPVIDYPGGMRSKDRYRLDDDRYIEGMSELVEVIHRHGCPTFMTMWHPGPWQTDVGFGQPKKSVGPVAASPVTIKSRLDLHNETPRALTIPEIEELVDKFASAAVRASKAGFDGVDLNCASSHLLHGFLSLFWNRRDDAFGGTTEKRVRFPAEIIREIKRRLGSDFPVSVIMNGIEIGQAVGLDDSLFLTHEESKVVARLLEEAGADAIQVRNGWPGYHGGGFLPDTLFYPEPPIPLGSFPKEYYKDRKGVGANMLLAKGMKQVLSAPVIAVGRLDPELGETMLEKGMADFIGMTRRLHADPELPNKLAAGKRDDIAPCTGCGLCLFGKGRCRVNGLMGTVHNTVEKSRTKKKVVVIGGGPAGMEAARVSALRGHDVTLFEKSRHLGGLLPLAAVVKGTHPEDLPSLISYLERQITTLGVKILRCRNANVTDVETLKPDVVFVATGGVHEALTIPGADGPNVVTAARLHRRLTLLLKFLSPETVSWLSRFYMPVGRRVVVIGGAIQGCETAEFLLKRGREVTIVETAGKLGEGMTPIMRDHLLLWFEKRGVPTFTGVRKLVEITAAGLTIETAEGVITTVGADTVLTALPLVADTTLARTLEGKVPEVYVAGDCGEPRQIADAIATAVRTARSI